MSRITGTLAAMIAAAFMAYIAGCGTGKRDSAVTSGTTTGVAAVGMTTCFKCHADNNNPGGMKKPFGDTQVALATNPGWVNSPHANTNSAPAYTTAGWDSSCVTCHDPGADGSTIMNFYLETALTAFGTADKPVAACETCHGNGGNHYGVGPLAYNDPDASRCGTCHNADYPHTTLARYPEQKNIYADWAASSHAKSVNASVVTATGGSTVTGTCARCHSDKGAKRYAPLYDGASTGQSTFANAGTTLAAAANIAQASPVQCKTCHDSHNPKRFLARDLAAASTVLANVNATTWSAEFATCNTCHQILNADGTKNAASYHDPAVSSQALDASLIPSASHFATSGSWTGAGGVNVNNVTGYDIAFSDARACTNCHNPHAIDTKINRQWSASKHGGDFTAAGPWAHYDWSQVNRRACQRCHTATGAAGYFDALRAGTAPPAFYIAAAAANTWKPELLHCTACHTDNKGSLRDPGRITASYYGDAQALADFSTTGAAPVTYPDAKGSNMCLACHAGRESGGSIKASTLAFTGGTSFINSHYLTAGGTVFAETGYTYYSAADTFNYTNPSFYKHDKIGLDATIAPSTGTNGPCVGCHMSSTENTATNYGKHRFLPVRNDASGNAAELTTTVCANCHAGQYSMTLTELEHQKTLFKNALEALKQVLASKGFYYSTAYPYWYANAAGTTTKTAWGSTKALGQQNMGAAFNYNLLAHDPGAFAHNRYYAKRLIYDSIDWMDDNVMNRSTPGTLNGLTDSATAPFKADAITYLIDSTSTSAPLTGSGTAQTGGRL